MKLENKKMIRDLERDFSAFKLLFSTTKAWFQTKIYPRRPQNEILNELDLELVASIDKDFNIVGIDPEVVYKALKPIAMEVEWHEKKIKAG